MIARRVTIDHKEYSLLAVFSTQKEVNALKSLLGLGYKALHSEKVAGGKIGVYMPDVKTINQAFARKFELMEKDAHRFKLQTNVQQMASHILEITHAALMRKSLDADEHDKEVQRQQHTDIFYNPDTNYYTLKLTDMLEDADEIVAAHGDFTPRLLKFKALFMEHAVAMLKAAKLVFPKETTMRIVETLKGLRVNPS